MVPKIILLFIIISAVVTACESPEPSALISPPPTSMPLTTSTANPLPTVLKPAVIPTVDLTAHLGGVLSIAARTVVDNLDIHRESSPTLAAFGPGIVYSRLLRFSTGPDIQSPSLAVECDLCTAWTWENTVSLRITLRENVRWQSIPPVNGRTVTTADVIASFERQLTAGWLNAPLLHNIKSIASEGIDLVFTLKSPDADFLLSLADGHSKVIPVELATRDDLRDGPFIGSGPWMIDSISPGTRYVFSANKNYFEHGYPYLDGLNIFVLPDESTRRAAFLTATLDVDEVKPGDWLEYQKSHPKAGMTRYSSPGVGVELGLNVEAPGLRDIDVRRALFLALDPWVLNQEIWNGLATVSGGLPAVEPSWLLSDGQLRNYLADSTRARQLLKDNGMPSSSIELLVADYGDNYLRYGEGVRDQLQSVGFDVSVRVLNPTLYRAQVWRDGQFQAYLGPTPPVSGTNSYLFGLVHSEGQWSKTGFSNLAMDNLILAQGSDLDEVKRKSKSKEIAKILLADGVRFKPAAQVQAWSWWPRVKNLHLNFANYEYIFWSRVWIEE
ncbi:MAG: ABC transporter substrate-binding protein [Chloroflexota bacterium]|nr:ABC transporter substrate-binding protein [Chloroflexota bacterium]